MMVLMKNLFKGKKEIDYISEISKTKHDILKNIEKLDRQQKEMALNIEEIMESNEAEETPSNDINVVKSLIAVMDVIDDFYAFADNDLKQHAETLRNSSIKKLSTSGIVRIFDENTLPDVAFNSIVATEYSDAVPDGYIVSTLKSGYCYNSKVIRKSQVVVNRRDKNV